MTDNVYNIYCDETRVENPEYNNMVIGALEIPRIQKTPIISEIKSTYTKHKFPYELKWTKVHYKYIPFYKELIDYFLSCADMNFRCIVVDKTKVKLEEFHDNDEELAFFKFYYLLLKEKLLSNNEYYIFLDKKPTRDRHRARALHHYLDSYILWNREACNIRHFQAIDSKDNILIQLTDFLSGLMGFACEERSRMESAKGQIVQYLKERLGRNKLCTTSPLSEGKFNVFVWQGTG
jgi:hypothetical protein